MGPEVACAWWTWTLTGADDQLLAVAVTREAAWEAALALELAGYEDLEIALWTLDGQIAAWEATPTRWRTSYRREP